MTETIGITDELSAYFCDKQTQAAVDFMKNAPDSNWLELSVNEFEEREKSENKKYDGYDNYSDAWLYSKKVQKDFFDFMANAWASSWGNLISTHFKNTFQPESFMSIKEVWKEDYWSRKLNFKQASPYNDLWLYCEYIRNEKQSDAIRLEFSLGNDEDYKMDGLVPPSSYWRMINSSGENYFVRDCNFSVKDNQVEISDMADAMTEMELYFRNKVFKT